MFCPECKILMFPEDGKFVCRRCGNKKDIESKDERTIVEKMDERETLILDGKLDTLPKTRAECSKCGNLEAQWWIRQTRAADEPETKFFRCTKCQHTWREY